MCIYIYIVSILLMGMLSAFCLSSRPFISLLLSRLPSVKSPYYWGSTGYHVPCPLVAGTSPLSVTVTVHPRFYKENFILKNLGGRTIVKKIMELGGNVKLWHGFHFIRVGNHCHSTHNRESEGGCQECGVVERIFWVCLLRTSSWGCELGWSPSFSPDQTLSMRRKRKRNEKL